MQIEKKERIVIEYKLTLDYTELQSLYRFMKDSYEHGSKGFTGGTIEYDFYQHLKKQI